MPSWIRIHWPDWIRILNYFRIRNPARKGEKAALYLAELLLLDHELDLLEGEAGSGSTDPIESGSNSDPDPQPCRKGRKSCCYLAELLLLDHELDLLEGEAGSESTDPTESGPNPDPDPQACQKERKSCFVPCLTPSSRPWAGSAGRRSWIRIYWPYWIRIQSGSRSATLPESEKKKLLCTYLAELPLLDHELDLLEGEGVLLQPEVQISQPEDVVVVQDQLRLLTK